MFRVVIWGIIIRREMQAGVCSERTWRMMKSIQSIRQLATDSARGTTRRNGIRRVCKDLMCVSFPGGVDKRLDVEYVRELDSAITG